VDGFESFVVEVGNEHFYVESGCLIWRDKKMIVAGLKDAKIPEDKNVEKIAAGAFMYQSDLQEIEIPKNIKTIGYNAFADSSLEEINVPGSLEFVDYGVYSGTPWLEKQGDFAVYGDFLLAYQGDDADVEIPETVRVVCGGAFDSTSVESVHIPESVTDIESYAFSYAENLLTVTGGANVQYVGYGSFDETMLWSNSPTDSPVRAGTMVVGFKGDLSDVLIIPNGVTIIGNNAFCGCTNITSVTLPASVKVINDWAFAYCESLEDVVFWERVTILI
jgi:hypothetical protein